jgi:mannose-6-phosphate isomerase-like protein (cupin superfamily)
LTHSWHCAMNNEQGVTSLPVISRDNAEHYVSGAGCDGWHLVKDSGLSVIEECMPAGASEVSHCHRKSRLFFYILSGQAVMETDGGPISLSVGQGVEMPPGTYHRFCNVSNEPVRFLVISQPPSHEDRVTK